MAPTSSTSDYRSSSDRPDPSQAESVMDQLSDTAQSVATDVMEAIKARPYMTMAIAGGLAFAIGALWMVRRQPPQTTYEAMLARLPSLPDGHSLWPSRWR